MTMDHGQWPHHYALVIMWMEWCVELYDMWIEMTSITSKQNLYLLVLSLAVAIMNRNVLDRDWCPSLGFRVKMPWSSAAGHMERETSQKLLLLWDTNSSGLFVTSAELSLSWLIHLLPQGISIHPEPLAQNVPSVPLAMSGPTWLANLSHFSLRGLSCFKDKSWAYFLHLLTHM